MAIIKYNPPVLEIRDNRNKGKGYYDANCEVCGTLFYPKRSNAKYCTTKCALIHHRISVANGTATKRVESKPTVIVDVPGTIINGRDYVIGWFRKKGIKVYGLETKLKALKIGLFLNYEKHTITRISSSKYKVSIVS
jgi:hypothetical protein